MTTVLLLAAAVAGAASPITYRLAYTTPRPGVVEVVMAVGMLPAPAMLVMPRAIPMGYGQQPYDRFVIDVEGEDDGGRPVVVAREDGPRWRLGAEGQALGRIRYRVDVARMEREIQSASDSSRARLGYLSLLGYSVFAFIEGAEDRPARLEVEVPGEWPVLTTLAPRAPPERRRTVGEAKDYYALADSQVVAGPDLEVRPLEGAVPFFLTLYAEAPAEAATLGRLAEEAMAAVVAYFGGAPFAHYTLIQEYLTPVSSRHGYGFSMEHLDSTTASFAADEALTSVSGAERRARTRYGYAHHFAHAWIPKRCYGRGYFPFAWELAPVIDSVWLSEGWAQYAAIDALADALAEGEREAYRRRMVEVRFRRTLEEAPPVIRRMSLLELSRVASTRYGEDFRTGRSVFSRGGMMAAEMDALVREKTGGKKRLRDALRHLVAWSAENRRAFDLGEVAGILKAATGVDVRPVMERWSLPL